MKISVGVVASLAAVLFFGGVATSSIAESKTTISKQAMEKALAHQERGNKFDDDGAFKNAISEYKSSLEFNPEDTNTLFNLGVVYLKVNESTNAVPILEKLSKLLPDDSEVYNLLGVAYSGAGKKSEAVSSWQKSLDLQPEQPKVKEMIAEIKNKPVVANNGKN